MIFFFCLIRYLLGVGSGGSVLRMLSVSFFSLVFFSRFFLFDLLPDKTTAFSNLTRFPGRYISSSLLLFDGLASRGIESRYLQTVHAGSQVSGHKGKRSNQERWG